MGGAGDVTEPPAAAPKQANDTAMNHPRQIATPAHAGPEAGVPGRRAPTRPGRRVRYHGPGWVRTFGLVAGLAGVAGLSGMSRAGETAPAVAGDAARAAMEPVPPRPIRTLNFRWENDAVAETDENYSNGIALSYLHAGRGLLGWVWDGFGIEEGTWFSSYDVGQIMVTPRDTDRPVPDPEDRPYVGMLYASAATHLQRGNQLHGLKFVIGVVGPASQAEEVQSWFHERIGSARAQGWAHQLHNEPIFNLVYEHRRKYRLLADTSPWSAEILPVGSAMLGNVLIQAQVGAQVRLGYQVPDDFGTTLIRGFGTLPHARPRRNGTSEPRWGVYLFASGSGVAVARNLSLDGNTFQDSPSVEKKPFFLTGEFGMTLWTRWVELTASLVWWGEEFENQERPTRFGTLAISVPL